MLTVAAFVVFIATIVILRDKAKREWVATRLKKTIRTEEGKKLAFNPLNILWIILGLLIVNFVVRGLFPEFWSKLSENQSRFWAINVAFAVAVAASLVKKVEKEDLPKNPGAQKFAKILVILALLGLIPIAKGIIDQYAEKKREEYKIIKRSEPVAQKATLDTTAALLVICSCESQCQQFKPGTNEKELMPNIPKPGKKDSGARGKYQFIPGLHWDRAQKMGFDLDTEKGQDGYARYLYENEGSFKHWMADPDGKACIESKVGSALSGTNFDLIVAAPVGAFGTTYDLRYFRGFKVRVDYQDLDQAGTFDVLFNDETDPITVPRDSDIRYEEEIRKLKLKSNSKDPIQVKVLLRQRTRAELKGRT